MQKFKTVVQAKHKFFDLKLKETLSYKDLIFLFVKRDFVSKYKQTILGPIWAIIQPLFTTLMNFLAFGLIAKLGGYDIDSSKSVPTYLFFMAGSVCWGYMSSTISSISNTFISNASIMGKVYYPRLVSPISSAISNLINFSINMALFIVAAIIFGILGKNTISFSYMTPMFFVTLLQMMLFGVGTGLFLSSFTTKYRDLTHLISFGLMLLGYLAPINYGYSAIYENVGWYFMLNPVSSIVLTFKYSLFGTGYFHWFWYAYSWIFTIVMLFLGVLLFNKTERTFMDTI